MIQQFANQQLATLANVKTKHTQSQLRHSKPESDTTAAFDPERTLAVIGSEVHGRSGSRKLDGVYF